MNSDAMDVPTRKGFLHPRKLNLLLGLVDFLQLEMPDAAALQDHFTGDLAASFDFKVCLLRIRIGAVTLAQAMYE